MITISAWLALDEATVENACVQIVPGAHKQVIPHVKAPPEMLFRQMADPNYISTQPVIDMELQPGQFFLFNEQTLHRSAANTSNYRRIGLAIRVTVPLVKVYHQQLFEGHKVIIVSGKDPLGFNQVTQPPPYS